MTGLPNKHLGIIIVASNRDYDLAVSLMDSCSVGGWSPLRGVVEKLSFAKAVSVTFTTQSTWAERASALASLMTNTEKRVFTDKVEAAIYLRDLGLHNSEGTAVRIDQG